MSPKRSYKLRCRRRAAAGRAGRAGRAARRGTGRAWAASCRICPRPPSARPPPAALLRCVRWRRRGAAAAGGWSWSGARWTWSASCAPTGTPTSRSTTATISSDARPVPRRAFCEYTPTSIVVDNHCVVLEI